MGVITVGLRPWSFLAFVGDVSAGWHSVSEPAPRPGGQANTFGAYGGLRVYPVTFGTVEPWVDAMLGYHQYTERSASSAVFDDDVARQLRRVGMRFRVGVDFAVGEHFALGPFFSWDPELGGVECTKLGAAPAACSRLHKLGPLDPPGAVSPGAQPQFMSFGVQAQFRL